MRQARRRGGAMQDSRNSTAGAALSKVAGKLARRKTMDFDDLLPPKKPSGATIGENLDTFSVAELMQRVKDLESEITRVRLELDRKRQHEAAARSLFKS
jgi:uncharacterized small protein (DUF1192 family)